MKKPLKLLLLCTAFCLAVCILFRQISGKSICLSDIKTDIKTENTKLSKTDSGKINPVSADEDYRPLAGTTVILDPGHGGNDPGMVLNDIYEKDINLQISEKLQEFLTELGCTVLTTRKDDSPVSLEDRVQLAEEQEADLFISIHLNAVDEDSVSSGIESYYNDVSCPGSRQLAEAVQAAVVNETGARDRGARGDSGLYVVRKTKIPSCLIEAGFLTSDAERPLLLSDSYQTRIAEGITKGILQYLSPDK
ncbi:MAG: N-acetylmuramoyl-L-alanine amidase [Lachnospiraceae bacterium]